MNSKKILFIVDHLKGGGAERIVLEVAEEFNNRGHDVSIALLDDKDTKMFVPQKINKININFDPIFYTGRFWRNRKDKFLAEDKQKVLDLVHDLKPDLIILSHNYAHFMLSIFKNDENIWAWVHGDIMPKPQKETSSLFYWYKEKRRCYLENRYFIKLFDRKNIIVVNEDLRNLYQKNLMRANVIVVPNGVNPERVLKNIQKNTEKTWECIFVGRLSAEKQPEHAIQAFAKSKLKGRMAVVGDGIMRTYLEALCVELKIQDRVDFLGWQEDPGIFIKESHCLVLSSKSEGSPLIIAEAITIGTPVVAYRLNSGIEQQLDYNQLSHGLVENQNIDDLSDKLYEVVKNPYTISEEDKNRLSLNYMMEPFLNLLKVSI